MTRKFLCTILLILLSLCLSGCWNYVGLNEIVIVTGIAVDKNDETKQYHLTFEIIDLMESSNQEGIKTKIIESDGKTIFDAVRNCKKKISSKLYFGDTQVVVVSETIAKEDGLLVITNFFLKDAEPRETISLVISQESTAKQIIEKKGTSESINSYEIKEILHKDAKVTASTMNTELYEVFNILNAKGVSAVVPSFHITINHGQSAAEANGIALFKKDKMLGYLTAEESKYYLFITNAINGGILTLKTSDKEYENVSLEISDSKTKRSYSYDKKKIKITINISTKVFLAELAGQTKMVTEKEIKKVQKMAEDKIIQNSMDVIKKVQADFNSDIFGFGQIIYNDNPKLWKKLQGDWDELFQTVEVEIKPKIIITNSGQTR